MIASEIVLGDAVLKLMREQVTEQRIREIVREELAKRGGFDPIAATRRLRDHRRLTEQLEEKGGRDA